ncbi:MAG: ABC transporter substrate-binding protein [Rhodospirillales bacterium]|nr:ABC transporter substrate-binding protein [Rhodospirillales bacterium]
MRATLLAFAALLGLAAPALTSPARAAGPERTLKIGLREDADILDPTLSGSYVGRIVYAGMCDKLFDYDTKLNIVPQLATGYEYRDPTHLILHIRPGVLFQDGEKLDAAAVQYTLNRDLTMPRSLRKGQINDIKDMKILGPLTLELVLKAPDAALLAQLAGRPGIMLAPKAAEKEGDKFGLHPVCAGPFRFVERIPQQKIVLERFKRYWNAKAIHFDKLEYIPIVNSAVRLANLQAGTLDLVEYIVPTDVAAVKKDPKLRIAMDTSLWYQGITFNTGNGPAAKSPIGANATLRRAFAAAIDRAAIIHVVYDGLFTPVAQANSPSSRFYVPSVKPAPRDIALAKKLVAESGVKPPIAVTLLTPNSPDLLQAAQVIQAMVQPAGFDLKIRAMEFASSLGAARSGDFQAFFIGWSGRADPDGNTYSFLHSGFGFNYGHYANPQVDALLDQARQASTVAARRALYAKLWAIEGKDMPILYLWSANNIVGLKKSLLGFRQVPDGIIRVQGMRFAK